MYIEFRLGKCDNLEMLSNRVSSRCPAKDSHAYDSDITGFHKMLAV